MGWSMARSTSPSAWAIGSPRETWRSEALPPGGPDLRCRPARRNGPQSQRPLVARPGDMRVVQRDDQPVVSAARPPPIDSEPLSASYVAADERRASAPSRVAGRKAGRRKPTARKGLLRRTARHTPSHRRREKSVQPSERSRLPLVTPGHSRAVVLSTVLGPATRQRGMRSRRTTRSRRDQPVFPAWLHESPPMDGA